MKTTHKYVAGLLVAALLVALAVALSTAFFRQTAQAAAARSHTYIVINKADDLLSEIRDAETGQRGYVLTGDESFLQPYLAVRDGITRHLKELRQITLIDAAHKHLDAVAPLIDRKLADLAQMAVGSGEGQRLMDSIRLEMKGFIEIEERALAQHDAKFQSNMRYLFGIIVAASLSALLFALSLVYVIYRQTQQRIRERDYLATKHLLEVQQQANSTLQVSEEKLAVTLNSIGDAVIATDAGGYVTLLNPVAEQLTGWKQAQASGHPVQEVFCIINQETRQPVAIPVMTTLTRGTIQILPDHTLLIARDGSERLIADSYGPIRDRNAQVVGSVLVFRDVTEEYAAQQALRDNAAQIQTILNTVVDGIITVHARDGIVQTVNPATERMFGYTGAELIGQKFSLLIPALDRDQPDGIGSIEYYRIGEELRASGLGPEIMGRRKDASMFPMEMAVSEMWLGSQRYFTGILRDITARKQADESLRDQQFYTRSLIESNIDALMTTDPSGIITDVNKQMEALTGCTRDELIGAPFKNYFTDPEWAEMSIKLVLRQKKVTDYELTARSRNGKETVVSFNASTFYDRDRTLQGVFAAARDVTERKRLDLELQEKSIELESAKAAAEKANFTKSEFLVTMSHEIRTPMNGVIGMIDVLQQSNLTAPQSEMASLIHDSAFALLAVINDILDFSRSEASMHSIERIPLLVEDVVEGVCETMDRMALRNGVELTMFIDPAIPAEVLGDPGRLRQILINLTNNAIKYSSGSQRTGQVSVRATQAQSTAEQVILEFQVTDNGIGMSEETQVRLFAPFTQADSVTTRNFGGTGQGLAISRQLTEILGGEITFQGGLGKGTQLNVRIPFQRAALNPEITQARSVVAGLTCLVVDRGQGLSDDLATYLAYDKALVERVADLAAASEWLESRRSCPCILIIDAADSHLPLEELRAAAGAHPEQETRFVVIGRGPRRVPRLEAADLVQVDGNVLSRKTLLKAVALAAGQAKESDQKSLPGDVKAASTQLSREETRQQGRLILVAEDNEINQQVIVQLLTLLGHTADIANDGREALTRWQSGNYGILMTDLHMPVMDGYELTVAIRAQEAGQTRIPIIAVTANVLQGEAERCLAMGMDDYLSKPVQLVNLKAMMDKWQPLVTSEPIPAQAIASATNLLASRS